jgi:hypothetical protein
MVVCVSQILLRLPKNHSLKGKKRISQQIIVRVKNKFNISVAEVEAQNQWQLIQLGLCQVGLDGNKLMREMDKVINFIAGLYIAEIIETEVETIHFSSKKVFYEKLSPYF